MNAKIVGRIHGIMAIVAMPIAVVVANIIDTHPEGFAIDANVAAILVYAYLFTAISSIYAYRILGIIKAKSIFDKVLRIILAILMGLLMAGILGLLFIGLFAIFSPIFWILVIIISPVMISIGQRVLNDIYENAANQGPNGARDL